MARSIPQSEAGFPINVSLNGARNPVLLKFAGGQHSVNYAGVQRKKAPTEVSLAPSKSSVPQTIMVSKLKVVVDAIRTDSFFL